MEDVRKAYIDIHKRNVLPIIGVAGDTASQGHLEIKTYDGYNVYINGYSWKNIINRIEALERG